MIRIRLAEVLKEKQITGYQLAEDSGLVKATIYNLINGKRGGIDFNTLDAICSVLDCQPGDLIVFDKQNNSKKLRNKTKKIK